MPNNVIYTPEQYDSRVHPWIQVLRISIEMAVFGVLFSIEKAAISMLQFAVINNGNVILTVG